MLEKIIVYGNNLEHYKYEKTSPPRKTDDRKLGRTRDISEGERQKKRSSNSRNAKVAFGRLCASNFGGVEIAVFGSFTFEESKSISEGYKCFNLFTRRLRKEFGQDIRYIAVPEFGKKNTQRLHFHALFWGLPLEKVKRERKTRYFAKIWGHGFIDLVITDNNPKVGYYLAKYLSKTYEDSRFYTHKSYVASRNIIRPTVYRDFVGLTLHYQYPIEDMLLAESREYDTMYLGRCVYKKYRQI